MIQSIEDSIESETLRREPLSLLDHGDMDASAELIGKCLQLQIARVHRLWPRKEDARRTLTETQVGSRAMRWLFDRKGHAGVQYTNHPLFAQALSYFSWPRDKSSEMAHPSWTALCAPGWFPAAMEVSPHAQLHQDTGVLDAGQGA